MANNVTTLGGNVIETIDEGGGVERQVAAIGSIGHAGSETQLTAGQKTAADSIPVTLNSDPDLRPASGAITAADSASTSANGQDNQIYLTGTPAVNSSQSWAINGQNAARLQITGTFVGALQFEGSIDGGTTWFLHPARVCASSLTRYAVAAPGLFDLNVAGLTNMRVRSTAWVSGTATVQPTFTAAAIIAPPSGVAVDGSRATPIIKGTLNNGQTSYSPNVCIGGLITIATGLPPGTILTAWSLRFKALYSASNAGVFSPMAFDANPAASTYVDNSAQSLAAADLAKMIAIIAGGGAFLQNSTGGVDVLTCTGPRMNVDVNGNIYVALITGAGVTFGSTNVLAWEFDGTY